MNLGSEPSALSSAARSLAYTFGFETPNFLCARSNGVVPYRARSVKRRESFSLESEVIGNNGLGETINKQFAPV